MIFRARASAPRGGGRATLRVFGLPLCILSLVGCRTYDDHRYRWYDGDYGYGYHHHRPARPVPQVYQPSPPPVFVVPQRPPPLPSQPPVIVRPPERKYEHPRRDDRPSHSGRDRDRGQHLNGGPDRKRGR